MRFSQMPFPGAQQRKNARRWKKELTWFPFRIFKNLDFFLLTSDVKMLATTSGLVCMIQSPIGDRTGHGAVEPHMIQVPPSGMGGGPPAILLCVLPSPHQVLPGGSSAIVLIHFHMCASTGLSTRPAEDVQGANGLRSVRHGPNSWMPQAVSCLRLIPKSFQMVALLICMKSASIQSEGTVLLICVCLAQISRELFQYQSSMDL